MRTSQRKPQPKKHHQRKNQSPQLKSEQTKRSRLHNWLFDLGEDSHMLAISIALYYVSTQIIYFIMSGYECLLSCNTSAESYRLTMYYVSCAYMPLISLVLVWMNGSRLVEKTLAFVFFILICDNVVMAMDAYQNLEEWNALNEIDYYIQLTADYILLPIGALCLLANLYYRQQRSFSSVHYF